MAKKFGLKFDGVAELSEQLDKLGGDLKAVTEEALAFIPADINPHLKRWQSTTEAARLRLRS